METLEPWLGKACLGLEVLVWEKTALREERETLLELSRWAREGPAVGLEWFSQI